MGGCFGKWMHRNRASNDSVLPILPNRDTKQVETPLSPQVISSTENLYPQSEASVNFLLNLDTSNSPEQFDSLPSVSKPKSLNPHKIESPITPKDLTLDHSSTEDTREELELINHKDNLLEETSSSNPQHLLRHSISEDANSVFVEHSEGLSTQDWKEKITEVIHHTLSTGISAEQVSIVVSAICVQKNNDGRASAPSSSLGEEMYISLCTTNSTGDDDTLYETGKLLASNGKHSEAIEYYKQALKNEIKAQYYHKIALSYYFLQNIEKAEEYCQLTLEQDSSYYQVYQILSSIYRRKWKQSKQETGKKNETAYKEQAEEFLSKYEKSIKDGLQKQEEEAEGLVERGLMSIESEEPQKINFYLTRAKESLKRMKSDLPALSDEQKAICESRLALLEDIQSCTPEVPTRASAIEINLESTARAEVERPEWNTHTRSIVQNALENFKLGLQQTQINTLRLEISQIHKDVQALQTQCGNSVRRAEVQFAIQTNAINIKEAEQIKKINDNPHLKEYFDSFVSTISNAYISSASLADGKIAINTGSLALDVLQQLLNLIPICGEILSTIIGKGIEFKQRADITKFSMNFRSIANDTVELHIKVQNAAREITLNQDKVDQILSGESNVTEGFFKRIISSIESKYRSAIEHVYGNEYNTFPKRLGHEDACNIISKYVKEYVTSSEQQKNNVSIIQFMITTVIHNSRFDPNSIGNSFIEVPSTNVNPTDDKAPDEIVVTGSCQETEV